MTAWQLIGGLVGLALLFRVYETTKNMVSREAQTRLERLPFAILRLARRRLPAEHRESIHDEEWLPELHAIVHETEGLPVTRLCRGVDYAVGLVFAAPKIAGIRAHVPRKVAELDLLGAARLGDQRAWEALVDRHADLVWNVARSFRLDQAEAADVSQATWLRLVEHIDDMHDADKLPHWLVATARYEVVVLLERRSSGGPQL